MVVALVTTLMIRADSDQWTALDLLASWAVLGAPRAVGNTTFRNDRGRLLPGGPPESRREPLSTARHGLSHWLLPAASPWVCRGGEESQMRLVPALKIVIAVETGCAAVVWGIFGGVEIARASRPPAPSIAYPPPPTSPILGASAGGGRLPTAVNPTPQLVPAPPPPNSTTTVASVPSTTVQSASATVPDPPATTSTTDPPSPTTTTTSPPTTQAPPTTEPPQTGS